MFCFENDGELDWKKIHCLPHRVALDTKSREFQYTLLNRPVCFFCGEVDESLEHIFTTWQEVIKWMGHKNIQIKSLSHKDIKFGITDEENLFDNHILLIAKIYIYTFV